MPGIVGIIGGRDSARNLHWLQKMVGSLIHDPDYRSGIVQFEKLGLWIGWACHAGSFSDCMPVWNETRDICLIFFGEHFADHSEIDRLRAAGHDCPRDNAGCLVHAYEEQGMRFFEMLNGCFSGVVVDLREGKAVLFNDRYGLNRIYHHENAEGFYFSSEAKSLLKVLPQLRQLDMTSFAEALSCGCALQDRTIFSRVGLLPGASVWTFTPQKAVRKESYFKKDSWENQPSLTADEYYEKMSETFTRILPRYFQGQQQIALSLTGGLDSRMIIAAAPVQPRQMPCYTFGGMYRECADVRLAKQIARVCGQEYEVIPVTQGFFSEFPDLARRSVYYTDGAMDVMGSVELFVNRTAKAIAPVRMTGNYGSEVLRANVAFKPVPLCEFIFDRMFVPFLNKAGETYASERRVPRTSFIAFKQVPWHHYARMAVERSQLTVRSPFLDNELVAVAYQSPPDLPVNKALAHRYIAEHNPALAGIPTDRGAIGGNGVPASKFAVFRQEFMPRAEYMFDYGMPQWLAKFDRVLAPLRVERLFLGRQKFYHFRTWYRDELAHYVKEVLLDVRTLGRPYLNGRRVEEIVTAHVTGRGNYTLEIHKLLTSELVQRQLIERS
jgi:asparagine synthase (glutamine-hydrolysing)